ncbi:hypothetical protein PR048_015940 [Dryococelus australis]|uniref:Uncharacterized protein n=1 Tax=Dryococelus australis TaxID=614101 RepID=A0ABQ9HIC9_9NEOP|nr:hypothetical protein PR048_015940 [Dryococelus australis]
MLNFPVPSHCGSIYNKYKHQFSNVLLALPDDNSQFIRVDVRAYRGNNDGAIFHSSSFGKRLASGQLRVAQYQFKARSCNGRIRSFPFSKGIKMDKIVLVREVLRIYMKNDNCAWQEGELEAGEEFCSLQQLPKVGGNNTSHVSDIRDSFKKYFVSPHCSVPC